MNEMIERVARELTSTLRHHGVELNPDDVRAVAIDAITAMREPTNAMKLVRPCSGRGVYAADFWKAMLDVALADDKHA